ncbi:MAG: ATP-binding protein, partial [Actinomycetota bacterium]
VPAVAQPFSLTTESALITRVTREVADGTVRLGTYVSGSTQLRYIATPVAVVPGSPAAIYLVAIDLDAATSRLTSGLTTYSSVALITLLAIGLVGWFAAGRLLRPLQTLTDAALAITPTDRTTRIPVVGNDDISRLTENVNAMLDRLDSALTTQRQLLEDVRHELRTPVTIVRGHLEVLDAEDSDQVAVTRAVAIRELDRMTRLIEEIESLADAQSATLVLRTVDVESFTTHMFEIAQGIPSRTWVLEGSGQGEVVMDAERVTQAWVQLVANAAKYSPEGSTVLIGSRVSPGEVEFWVSDTGPGIPPAARERIFERFGRVDQSRGSSGSGLGLAIVRAIVIAHGGRVTLISSDTGSRFGLVIPRTEGL